MDVQEDHVLNGDANSTERMFSIIKAAGSAKGPRLGRLQVRGRHLIETPHFLGITSRGVVPHITQDTFARDTGIPGVYVPLEDCESAHYPPEAFDADPRINSVKL